jgi:hypothetical protein
VVAISWKLLDHILTRTNLAFHNIIPPEVSVECALYELKGGTTNQNHLFLFCDVARRVWKLIIRWQDFWLIWQATILVIWNARNNRILNNDIKEVEELVDEIKVLP